MNKNYTLYFFEGLACLLVVLIHAPFPGTLGIIFSSAGRFAVPFFFMISGFSLFDYLGTPLFCTKIKKKII